MASASSRSTLQVLLQELQTVLPKALDVSSAGGPTQAAGMGGGTGSGGGTDNSGSAGAGGSSEDVSRRLRSVLFALLQGCLGCRPVKQKETHSVLRVTTVVLERMPAVFAGNACGTVLSMLLRLLAEPSAYASPPLMDQLLRALCGVSDLLAAGAPGLLLDLHAGLLELVFDLEQALVGLSLLPPARPAAQELPLCLALTESLAARSIAGAPRDAAGADVAGARDTGAADDGGGALVGGAGAGASVGGGHAPLRVAVASVDDGEAAALLAVRLLSYQLGRLPALLGPATPGSLVGVLGRFLACDSGALQEATLHSMGTIVRLSHEDAAAANAALTHALWLLDAACDGLLPPGAVTQGWQRAVAAAVRPALAALADAGAVGAVGERALRVLARALALGSAPDGRAGVAALGGDLDAAAVQACWLGLLLDLLRALPDLAVCLIPSLPLQPAGDAATAPLAACWHLAVVAMAAHDCEDALRHCLSCYDAGLAAALGLEQQNVAGGGAVQHQQQRPTAAAAADADGPASPPQGGRGKKRRKLKQAQLGFGDDGVVMTQRTAAAAGAAGQHHNHQHPLLAGDSAATTAAAAQGASAAGPQAMAVDGAAVLPAVAAAERLLAALAAPNACGAGAPAEARVAALRSAASIAGALAAAGGAAPAALVAFAGAQAARCAKRATERSEPAQVAELALLLAFFERALHAAACAVAHQPAGAGAAMRHAWRGADDAAAALFAMCTPTHEALSMARVCAVGALRAGLAWRAATKLLSFGSTSGSSGSTAAPGNAASFQAADALLSAVCGNGGGGRARAVALQPGARTAAAYCLPLWCLLQHSAPDSEHRTLTALPGAIAPGVMSAASGIARSAGSSDAAALEALGACLGAATCLLRHARVLFELLAAWLTASLDAVQHGRHALDAVVASPASSGAQAPPDDAAAGLSVQAAWPILEPLVAHGSAGVAAAGLAALGQLLSSSSARQLAGVPAEATAVLSRAVVERLVRASADAPVREAALGVLPMLLRLQAPGDDGDTPSLAAGGAPLGGGDTVAASEAAELSRLHPAVALVAGGLADARARATASAAAAAAATPNGVPPEAERVALLRAAAALAAALAGRAGEAPLLVALADHSADDDPQVAAAAAELLQHRAAAAGQPLQELLLRGPCAPRVLRHVGLTLGSRPALLGDLALLLRMQEPALAEATVQHVIGPICERRNRAALELLAQRLGAAPSNLLIDHAGAALAHVLWLAPAAFEPFAGFVGALVAPHGFLDVVQVTVKEAARQAVRLAGLPCFWRGPGLERFALQPALLARARAHLETLAGLEARATAGGGGGAAAAAAKDAGGAKEARGAGSSSGGGGAAGVGAVAGGASDDPVVALLLGQATALLFKEFGAALGGGGGGAAGSGTLPAPAAHNACPGRRHAPGAADQAGAATPAAAIDAGLEAKQLQSLRALAVLVELLGDCLGSHALQVMALLSEALRRAASADVRLQALAAWLVLVRGLAARTPQLLERVAPQAAVALLPMLEAEAGAMQQQQQQHQAILPDDGSNSGGGIGGSGNGGNSGAAAMSLAAAVLSEMVLHQRHLVRRALAAMPPLPDVPELAEVNAALAAEHRSSGPEGRLALLVRALRSESPAVRHAALGELRAFLRRSRGFVRSLVASTAAAPGNVNGGSNSNNSSGGGSDGGGGAAAAAAAAADEPPAVALLSDLVAALLASCGSAARSHLGASMRQRCAECLGLLGAIDPSRLRSGLAAAEADRHRMHGSASAFLVALVTRHLVRILETSTDTRLLELTVYAIQHLLQHYTPERLAAANGLAPTASSATTTTNTTATGGRQRGSAAAAADQPPPAPARPVASPAASEPGSLFSLLPDDVRPIVAPYLTTRFFIPPSQRGADACKGPIFGSHPHSHRRWMNLWLKRLFRHARGPLAEAFAAVRGAMGYDAPLMAFVLPYAALDAAAQGGAPRQLVRMEMAAVAACAAGGAGGSGGPAAAAAAAAAGDPGAGGSGPGSRAGSVEGGGNGSAGGGGSASGGGAGTTSAGVLPAPAAPPPDVEVYVQTLFTLADALGRWVKERTAAHEAATEANAAAAAATTTTAATAASGRSAGSAAAGGELPADVANVEGVLSATPPGVLARAALRVGALARALQYFETHARAARGGGLNPASAVRSVAYGHDEVAFLLEAYGRLEEPDGIEGVMHLRAGGLTTSDRMLSAEKAGDWSEALALYEQALARREEEEQQQADRRQQQQPGAGAAAAAALAATAGALDEGLPPLQQGHLRCLLHAGRLQTLLRVVDGLLARSNAAAAAAAGVAAAPLGGSLLARASIDARAGAGVGAGSSGAAVCQLSALGVAAAWRMGAWQLLRGYLSLLRGASAFGCAPAAVAAAFDGAPLAGGALCPGDAWEATVGGLLEAMQRGARDEVAAGLAAARDGLLAVLPAVAAESYARAYPLVAKLHMLSEAEEAFALMMRDPPPGPLERRAALEWADRYAPTQLSVATREPLLALRRQLASLLKDPREAASAWLAQARLARAAGQLDGAEAAALQALAAGAPGAELERCRLLWAADKGHRAIRELEAHARRLGLCGGDGGGMTIAGGGEDDAGGDGTGSGGAKMRAQLALQLAAWKRDLGQGHREDVAPLFEAALDADPSSEAAHFAHGAFLDGLYVEARARRRAAAGAPAGGRENDRTGGRLRIRAHDEAPGEYLAEALSAYAEAVRHGSSRLLQAMPRLLTLYFESGSDARAAAAAGGRGGQAEAAAHRQATAIMRGVAGAVPPLKWLLVLPQLTSRVTHPHPDVAAVVEGLLGKLLDAAPHQALWALAGVTKAASRPRAEAGARIVGGAKQRAGEGGRRLFDAFAALHAHLVKLCPWQPETRAHVRSVSARKHFPRLVGLLPVEVQVPTQALFTLAPPPPPDAAGGRTGTGGAAARQAGGLHGHAPPLVAPATAAIAGLEDEVLLLSSLQRPKKVTFLGSDGRLYPFLAKPKDDLRKDYRLMDFAGVLNALLARDPAARRRGLGLRTYAVLPLADDCGVLQWVEHLVPFKGACEEAYAAERLYNRRTAPAQIRKLYDSWQGPRRADLLDRVLGTLPPRMHRWLLARFPEPGAWLAARQRFARTAAAWSMVGHVLGLGDRHGENIMVDAKGGGVMHVDFGCLFDRGLTLEVPEVVPFRLTQNVADACGVSGAEGAFRRAAEITLGVLRGSRAALMTTAETFLADPLVEWTKAHRGAGTELDNPMAKDALATIDGRLSGSLIGVVSLPAAPPLSVEGQVARLIAEAVDHENLGRMYIWWMPWF